MEPTVTWNKNSLHYRLARTYGTLDKHIYWTSDPININICTYIKCVLAGVLTVLMILVVGAVLVVGVGDMLAYLAVAISFRTWGIEAGAPAVFAMVMSLAFAVIAVVLLLFYVGGWLVDQFLYEQDGGVWGWSTKSEPSFIGHVWRSFKDKVCFIVEIK